MYGSLYLTRVSRYFSVICKSKECLSSDWLHAVEGENKLISQPTILRCHVDFCNYWFSRYRTPFKPLYILITCELIMEIIWANEKCFQRSMVHFRASAFPLFRSYTCFDLEMGKCTIIIRRQRVNTQNDIRTILWGCQEVVKSIDSLPCKSAHAKETTIHHWSMY